ncbi:hypothetical protein Tco_1125148 [Tanacetum coccineum]|uniref:GAG-pre-integrase domain-containing protein n=1 Tax=Tanacetum coccineum TaxID=301880 RepID=A0ABQ5JB59_9ASTR
MVLPVSCTYRCGTPMMQTHIALLGQRAQLARQAHRPNSSAHSYVFSSHIPSSLMGILRAAPPFSSAFNAMTLQDPTWNMDTDASSHINSNTNNNCTVEFDAFGFSVKDFLTSHILLRCDSSGDLYPVTQPSPIPHALLSVSPSMWPQRLGHPGDDVLRSLVSHQFISYNKEKSPIFATHARLTNM